MTIYIKDPHTAIFSSYTSCWKSHVVLDLKEKECKKHYDYIIINCPTLRLNKTYHTKGWIRQDENVWLIIPKDKLYQ